MITIIKVIIEGGYIQDAVSNIKDVKLLIIDKDLAEGQAVQWPRFDPELKQTHS